MIDSNKMLSVIVVTSLFLKVSDLHISVSLLVV